jgi:hypothetical protein
MSTLEWKKELKVGEKFKNLNNCSLDVFSFGPNADKKENEVLEPQRKLMKIICERLNFTAAYVRSDAHPDFSIGIYMDFDSKIDLDTAVTSPFTVGRLQFVISEAELYKPYEKILLPFDGLTWYLLLATFGIAFGVIFAVSFMKKRWQYVVYGEGVRMPAYNVLGTFFGISQLRLPNSDFARVILIQFIWFSLIIRTAYQGVFFELFTTDMRKPQPRTINELIERNYTIKGDFFFFHVIAHRHQVNPFSNYTLTEDDDYDKNETIAEVKRQNYRTINGNFEFIAYDDTLDNICNILRDPSAKTAYLVDLNMIESIKRNCSFEPEILDEVMYESVDGVSMQLHHYLYSYIADVTQRLVEAGIVQSWYDFIQFVEYRVHVDPKDRSPKVLTLEKLSFGFIIYLAASGVAVVVLIAEIVYHLVFDRVKPRKIIRAKVEPADEAEEEEKAAVDARKVTKVFRVVDAEEASDGEAVEESTEAPQEPTDDDKASVKSFGYLFGQKLSVYAGFDEPLVVVDLEEV